MSAMTMERAATLVERLAGWTAHDVSDASAGRGIFSTVWRVTVTAPDDAIGSVVVKLPVDGPNGRAARASGAYEREALAYGELLPTGSRPRHPRCFLVDRDYERGASFVLEDLGGQRMGDQAAGLSGPDALSVVASLAELHRRFLASASSFADLPVRVSAPSVFTIEGLRDGLLALERRQAHRWLASFAAVVERRDALVEAFTEAPAPTLCHGDPRADNVAFDHAGEAILFDWQQLAIQLGESDLAWLCGTSMTVETRRQTERSVVARYAELNGLDETKTWNRYRLGYVLPGLAVLFLAQRETADRSTEVMIANSIERIGAALDDLDLAAIV